MVMTGAWATEPFATSNTWPLDGSGSLLLGCGSKPMDGEHSPVSETPSPRQATGEARAQVECRNSRERWMLRLTILGVGLGAVTAACAIATAWHDLDDMYAKKTAHQEALVSPPKAD